MPVDVEPALGRALIAAQLLGLVDAGGQPEHLLLGRPGGQLAGDAGRRCITRMRSDMPMTSGSSLDTISTATPWAASARMSS